jgi:phosphopantothenoylcysteine decarboxylase/phosphopantothenate--cysteine ligase
MALAALSGQPVYHDLFSLKDESEMGHIRLSREADLVVVAPATANLIAKMACGIADDLAATTLLATDKPVLIAPAMNVRMWHHAANQRNVARLLKDGITVVDPAVGPLADGETGMGRLADVAVIVEAIGRRLAVGPLHAAPPLAGRRVLVTAGPTVEPIDPVRYISNRSSGRQGYAIAGALARLGAEVTLVSGPTQEVSPPGVVRIDVTTAAEMLAACQRVLPADAAICVAAVADWRVAHPSPTKIKRGRGAPTIELAENPDILVTLAKPGPQRPPLVVGFAAETDDLERHAAAKLKSKGCDWIVANSVADGAVFGQTTNRVTVIDGSGSDAWPELSKEEVAERLARRLADHLGRRARTRQQQRA